MRVGNGELRRRAAELGVSVSYWDWQGHEVIVSDETLAAIVAALETVPTETVPPADGAQRAPDAVAPVPAERSWGFAAQLYSLRSRDSWGHGDLRDLANLAAWSARDLGAGFVLINPLHAAEPLPPVSPSPYLPMSRRWVSPLYLRIEDIPEAPWYVVDSADKRRARINMIAHLLSTVDYHDVQPRPLKLPPRPASQGYIRTPRDMQAFVPDHAADLLAAAEK